jgi:maltooligosyltrehalose trehalohydrolase
MTQELSLRVRPGTVRYELDVRTFTDDGSFQAAAEHLDHLVDLGVDVVELIPGPAEADSGLQDFVDACHGHGLAVLLGLSRPVSLPQLRQLFVWYRLDGVRAPGIDGEVVRQVAALAGELGRPLAVLPAGDQARRGAHALHALFAGGPLEGEAGSPETLADVLHESLLHAGALARGGHKGLGAHHFVGAAHNPHGDRALLRVGATLLLTGPFTPLVFMGEEWGASARHANELAVAGGVRSHRHAYTVTGPGHTGLDWSESKEPGHAELLAFYQRLIALRRATADLADPRPDRVRLWYGDQFIAMRRGDCGVVANLAPVVRRVSLDQYPRRVLLATEHGARVTREAVELPPYSAIIVSYA